MSTKLFLHTILFHILWLAPGLVSAAIITSSNDGTWMQSTTWSGGALPLAGDDAVIKSIVTIPNGETVEINNITINADGKLVVYGTLIVNGNFIMEFTGTNFSEFEMGPNSVVVVNGNVDLSNKVILDLSSYFIVKGNFTQSGGQGELSINDAHIYLFGSVNTSWNNFTSCDDSYSGTTSDIVVENCDFGNDIAFENNADNGIIPNDIVEIVDNNNCCGSSAYRSRNAYTGDWKDINSWSTPNDSWRPLPPPNDPVISQSLCIKGYITLDDNLTIGTADQIICDTLVITGDLYMTSNSFTVAPGGVLIVLGDFEAGSGSLVNNEGGKIVFAGEFSKTYSYSFSGTGDTYVFDPDPLSEGFTPTGDQDFLESNDPTLYDFYTSLVGGVPPSADCQNLTVSLDASGQASILPADVHDGPLKANLTYTLSQSNFDCTDLGENTITLTATNSGGLSDECTVVVTVEDNLAPTITCPTAIALECTSDIPSAYVNTAALIAAGGSITDDCALNEGSFVLQSQTSDDLSNPEMITRTYYIEDISGNSATCQQQIVVHDVTKPVLSGYPSNINNNVEAGTCSTVASWVVPTATDNCDGVVSVIRTDGNGYNSGDEFPVGVTTISYSATDNAGNEETHSFSITVTDNEVPTITCPDHVTAYLTDNPLTIAQPTFSDNCPGASVINSFNSTDDASDTYPMGTTIVHWTVTDNSGNTAGCDMEITVLPVCSISDVLFTPISCKGRDDATITISATGSDQINYSIDGGNNFQTSNIFTGVSPGTYTIQISDATGCSSTWPEPIVIYDASDILYAASNDTNVCRDGTANLSIDLEDRSMAFSGSNQWIDIPNNNSINTNPVTNRTIALWFKANNVTNRQVLYEEGGGTHGISIFIEAGYVYVHAWESNTSYAGSYASTPRHTIETGNWHHVAFVMDSSEPNGDYIKGYFNGIHMGSLTDSRAGGFGLPSHGGDVNIAMSDNIRFPNSSSGSGNYYNGSIDEFKLWNSPLSAQEIQAEMYHVSNSPSGTNMILYYNFNDDSGNTIENSASGSLNGTNRNANHDGDTPFTPTVTWSPSTGLSATTGVSVTAAPGASTTYTYTLTEPVNGCQTQGEITVSVTEMALSESIIDVSCHGNLDGSIDLTVSGGTTPYRFAWTTSDGSGLVPADEDQTGLSMGTYDVTVTDDLGCTAVGSYTVLITEDVTKPIITTCPPDTEFSCVKDLPHADDPEDFDYAGFVGLGGAVSDNCTAPEDLNFSYVDVTDKKDAINPCEVVRTYTITDEAGNTQTCTQTFTITDSTAPEILDCPDGITDTADENCEKVISVAAPTNFTDGCGFGDVTVYHAYTIDGNLVEAAGGIVDVAFPKGTSIVTWSYEDECGNVASCEQAITIEDNTAPTASCPASQELDSENACSVLLPDYTNLLTGLTDNCDSNPTVTQRPAENTEVFTNTEIWLIYADEDGNQDSCSFMVSLTYLAPLDISEMIYDGDQLGVGAIGSGQKPFITSIHSYEIDRDETTPEDYTYTWLVLDQLGTEVTPDISYPDDNPRNAVIAFSETYFTEGKSYTIRVIKEQLTGNCSAVFELDTDVQETDFNSGVDPLGPTCQDGGTGAPTVVFWDVEFTGGVEPYAFDFSISDGTDGCTGQVSNLFTNDSESIVHTENCDETYGVAVTQESGAPAVQIAFTFISEAGVDKDFNLTIQSATDQFSITKQTINTDESDNVTLWGVPNTSDIETD